MNVFLIMGFPHSGKTSYILKHKRDEDAFVDSFAVQSLYGFNEGDDATVFKINYITACSAAHIV